MKKVILTICGAVLLAASLAGCCMKHEWAEATCTEPKKCVKCGACVKKCPQHINVPERMADVAHRLQPPGVNTALKLANPILSHW